MSTHPFVGRVTELDFLRTVIDDVADLRVGRFVLVTGEPGLGKTRLCSELSQRLGGDEVLVWSRCWEGGGPALWPWSDVLAELEVQLGRPFDLTRDEVVDRFTLFQAVVERLRGVCAQRPVVVLIDDLHLASEEALLLTRFVARSLHRFGLVIIATWRAGRDTGGPHPVRDATVIELAPLRPAEISDYVRAVAHRAVSDAEVADLAIVTGGNPMFLAELVLHPGLDEAARAEGLTSVLRRRLHSMDESARRVLGIAALLGHGAHVDEVAMVARCDAESVIESARDRSTGALVIDDTIRFEHDLIREAYAAALPAAARLDAHAAAVGVLEGASVERVLRRSAQAVAAAPRSAADRHRAVAACAEAAAVLETDMAFEQAAAWARRGTELAAGVAEPALEAGLLLAEARAELAAGQLTAARERYQAAIEPATRSNDPRLLARAALGMGGVWVEEQRDDFARRRMLGLCREARVALGDETSVLGALLAVRIAAEEQYDGDLDADIAGAVEHVRELGDHASLAEALSLYHHTLLNPFDASRRLGVAEELIDVASRTRPSSWLLFGLCWRTIDLYLLGDTRAERAFVELRRQAAALGNRTIGYIVAVLDVMRTLRRGDLAEAERLAGDALALGEAVGDADALAYYGGHLLGIRWAQGRLDEMYDIIANVVESATLRGRDRIYDALLGYLAALRGDVSTARAQVDGIAAEGFDRVLQFSTGLATMAILADTAAELQDSALGGTIADHLAPHAHLPVMPSLAVICLGPAHRPLGVALAAAGHLDEAVGSFREALTANARLQNRPFEAMTKAQLARVLHQRGTVADLAEATSLLDAAIALARPFGASDRLREWEAELAVLDARAGWVAPQRRPLRGRLVRVEHGWQLELAGHIVAVGEVVGMRHLAQLLAHPDTGITASELSATAAGEALPLPAVTAEPVLDDRARREYQRRLHELDHELDVADLVGDVERGRRAAGERDVIVGALRTATGLGGRRRHLGDDLERTRMRVSKAIHRAIAGIAAADPTIGGTLASRIRTGHVCEYVTDPMQPVVWDVRAIASG